MKSTTEKLSNIGDGVIAGLRKQSQKDYLRRLTKRLELLEKVFVFPALNPNQKEFLWPRDEDLRDIDQCIFGLAGTLRKKKLLTHTEATLLVEKKWSSLRLARRLLQLMEAGLGHPPPALPPDPPESLQHFIWIKDLAKSHGRTGDLARQFIRDHQLLRCKRRRLSQIKWRDYKELLLSHDGKEVAPQCPIPFESFRTSCCVRYLEMEREFWLWSREFDYWKRMRELRGDSAAYFEWLKRNDLRDSGLDGVRLARRRKTSSKRQARYRRKMLAKKRDEIPEIPLGDLPMPPNLRHNWDMFEAPDVH